MTGNTKQYKLAALLAVLAMTVNTAYCNDSMEDLKTGASRFGTGMDIKELMGTAAGITPGSAPAPVVSELRLRDAMKVMKKGFWESKSAFYKRTEGEIRSVLSGIFPLDDTCKVELYDHLCGRERENSYPGLAGHADWRRGDWKYTVLLYACSRDPLYIKYVSIAPVSGDGTKMPETREEFVSLVGQLSYVKIADAEEAVDYKGRKIITRKMSADGKASVSTDYLGLLDDSERTGAIFFAEPSFANLGFFPRVTLR